MIMRNKKLTISNMICNKAYISTVRIEQTLMKEISLHAIIFLFLYVLIYIHRNIQIKIITHFRYKRKKAT